MQCDSVDAHREMCPWRVRTPDRDTLRNGRAFDSVLKKKEPHPVCTYTPVHLKLNFLSHPPPPHVDEGIHAYTNSRCVFDRVSVRICKRGVCVMLLGELVQLPCFEA